MFTDGLVSVITPVYNAEKHIEQTVRSALSQTYKNIEVILVDDCSQDNSANIIAEIAKGSSAVKRHRFETNMGAAEARNKALSIAGGRYVAFLDSDDYWEYDKIEKQLRSLEQTNSYFSYTAIDMVDENGAQIKGKRRAISRVYYRTLLRNTIIATSSVLVDRKRYGAFRMPPIRSGQDYATWLSLLRDGSVAVAVDEPLTHYRVSSSNSLSSNKTGNYRKVFMIQTQYEGIGKTKASFNVLCYCVNAVLKYFL